MSAAAAVGSADSAANHKRKAEPETESAAGGGRDASVVSEKRIKLDLTHSPPPPPPPPPPANSNDNSSSQQQLTVPPISLPAASATPTGSAVTAPTSTTTTPTAAALTTLTPSAAKTGTGSVTALSVYSGSDRGKKSYQQDAKILIPSVHEFIIGSTFKSLLHATSTGSTGGGGGVRMSYYSVLDGHGGEFSLDLLKQLLHTTIFQTLDKAIADYKLPAATATTTNTTVAAAAGAAPSPPASPSVGGGSGGGVGSAACKDPALVRRVLIESFKAADRDLLTACNDRKPTPADDGVVVVSALVIGDVVWIAYTGDARAVLGRTQKPKKSSLSKQSTPTAAAATASVAAAAAAAAPEIPVRAIPVTNEHTPLLKAERERIEKAGGTIEGGRVNGRLGVSRSFGDRLLKRYGVSAQPDITKFTITRDDHFLLLGCDGLFSVFSADAAIQFVAKALAEERHAVRNDPNARKLVTDLKSKQRTESVEQEIVRRVTQRLMREVVTVLQAKDNVTAILIVFDH